MAKPEVEVQFTFTFPIDESFLCRAGKRGNFFGMGILVLAELKDISRRLNVEAFPLLLRLPLKN